MDKIYGVIGLGKFGFHLAKGLVDNNENVILCDSKETPFQELKDRVEQIYVLDSTDKRALKEAGIAELDVVIVSIGENIEASILTVMALKELKNKRIIAKAVSATHGAILEKLGVDEVVYPERQAAFRLLSELTKAKLDTIDLSANMKSCKTIANSYFAKRSIKSIANEDGIKIVAIKRDEEWNLDFNDDFLVQKNDILLFLGTNLAIEEISKKIED
ncbi:TrkA [Helicobacter sp. 13S00401-1]|uniref:potassium channel family protein n=1 Tax=Helicobacter sp. 13S00401-1 TaxID=1905758 RepID=UPI000BA639E6|nr:TrkA family potassium uptake protein [Helicobacter sp. 13S00401-1]PAF49694.1 TrkA [Helicobacter sp. 13S00401-1]